MLCCRTGRGLQSLGKRVASFPHHLPPNHLPSVCGISVHPRWDCHQESKLWYMQTQHWGFQYVGRLTFNTGLLPQCSIMVWCCLVSCSHLRNTFKNFINVGDIYIVSLEGAPGEKVTLTVFDSSSLKTELVECTIGPSGSAVLHMASTGSSCTG